MSADHKTPVPEQGDSDPTTPTPMPSPMIPPTPDDARARPEALKKPATGGSSGAGNIAQLSSEEGRQGRVMPPAGTVEVPNQPKVPDADTPDEAAKYGDPSDETSRDANWSDNVPDAKKPRSSLF